jgi:hypothetical protein
MEVRLYQYAVIMQPRFSADDELVDPGRVVVEPTTVLAESQDKANLLASRAIPEKEMQHLDRLEILVRPF